MAGHEVHRNLAPTTSQELLIAGAPEAASSEDQRASAATESNEMPFSTTVDVGADAASANDGPVKASFWSSVVKVALSAEEHLAELFGLNQSKYQWAVDEFMDQQLSGEAPRQRPALVENEREMHPTGQQQTMQRDGDQVADTKMPLSP